VIGRLPRPVRIALQVAVSAAIVAYLLWQIDVGETIHLIASAPRGFAGHVVMTSPGVKREAAIRSPCVTSRCRLSFRSCRA